MSLLMMNRSFGELDTKSEKGFKDYLCATTENVFFTSLSLLPKRGLAKAYIRAHIYV